MNHDRPMLLPIVFALMALFIGGMFVIDVCGGAWNEVPAVVSARQFVPDRSHWEPRTNCYGSGNSLHCQTTLAYISIPAQYLVLVTEDSDGRLSSFNDPWAWSNLHQGDGCMVRVRIGGRTHWRWYSELKHVRPVRGAGNGGGW